MRLTLRTLLAYLDQILDESDAEELERKIQESELATQLVHRIRSVMGQRRLAALDVRAGGLGRDANSVAEYLDNTLPVEQIPDFERVCLESDIHLSEVAACHQILTLVLGEPAAIPEGLKEKIYHLTTHQPERPQSVPDTAQAAPPTVPPVAPPGSNTPDRSSDGRSSRAVDDEALSELLSSVPPGKRAARADTATPLLQSARETSAQTRDEDEHWTEAPDYLKRSRPARWKPIAVVALIAFCLTIAALRGMGPLNRTHPLAQRLGFVEADAPTTPEVAVVAPADRPGLATDRTDDRRPRSLEPSAIPAATVPAEPAADDLEFTQHEPDQADDLAVPESVDPPDEIPLRDDRFAEFDALDESVDESFDSVSPANDPLRDEYPLGGETDRQSVEGFAGQNPGEDTAVDFSETFPGAERESPGVDNQAGLTSPFEPEEGEASDPFLPLDAGEGELAAGASRTATPADLGLEAPVAGPALVNPLATNRADAAALPPLPPQPRLPNNDQEPSPLATDELNDQATVPDAPLPPRKSDVGRFLDAQQVLVKFDPETTDWRRITAGTQLQVGDLLMSLPTYRTPLVLASGMQVTLIGGTRVEVLEPDSESTPNFRLEFGRLTIAAFTQSGTSLGLHWGADLSGVLTIDEMSTTLAVELRPESMPGADPELGPPHQVLHVFVTSGSAEWTPAQGPAITISAGQRLTLIDNYPALLKDVTEQPAWIEGRDGRPIDPVAARELSQRLTPDRPVMLVLKEATDGRRVEIRSLAACSLAYLGDFDPLFVALNDSEFRAYWPAQHEVLQRLPNYSPEFAAAIKRAMVQRHGEEEGAELYRLLGGFSPDQLAAGSAADLFDLLDHPSIDFRILASELLKSITGQPSLYRANAAERDPQRRAAVSRWRKMLDDGKIIYQRPPEIVTLLNEVVPDQP